MSVTGIKKLTTHGVLALMLYKLETLGNQWFSPFTKEIGSTDPDSEEHAWLTGTMQMTEQTGDPELAEPPAATQTVRHKDWVCGFRMKLKHWLANKTSMVEAMIDEQVEVAMSHPGQRIQELIVAGEAATCYDGQFYFDTDHAEGDSGTQDNDITYAKAGTLPTVAESKAAILKAIGQMMGFKDAKGNYLHLNASEFVVLCPTAIYTTIAEACVVPLISGGETNILGTGQLFKVKPQVIPAWSGNKFAVVRARSAGKGNAFVKQTFIDPKPVILGPDSEHAKLKDEVLVKVSGTYQLAYARWQEICLCTFTGP
jgi:hypothetical protein